MFTKRTLSIGTLIVIQDGSFPVSPVAKLQDSESGSEGEKLQDTLEGLGLTEVFGSLELLFNYTNWLVA